MRAMRELSVVEKFSIKATQWIGTPASIIIHTIFFVGIFSMKKFGYTTEEILLILTTVVSLEAIYLGIFIQMTVNRQDARLRIVRKDIKEISEDIEEIQEDVEEIQENVEELGEDFDEISEDMEKDDAEEEIEKKERDRQIQKIETVLQALLKDIEELRGKK
ncbi:MAG: DUF1003 domain-containing protein [Parcubacteria group bacterium]|nr:DUF1003 domain-containing protein [Parcubacteria group bacterium]